MLKGKVNNNERSTATENLSLQSNKKGKRVNNDGSSLMLLTIVTICSIPPVLLIASRCIAFSFSDQTFYWYILVNCPHRLSVTNFRRQKSCQCLAMEAGVYRHFSTIDKSSKFVVKFVTRIGVDVLSKHRSYYLKTIHIMQYS